LLIFRKGKGKGLLGWPVLPLVVPAQIPHNSFCLLDPGRYQTGTGPGTTASQATFQLPGLAPLLGRRPRPAQPRAASLLRLGHAAPGRPSTPRPTRPMPLHAASSLPPALIYRALTRGRLSLATRPRASRRSPWAGPGAGPAPFPGRAPLLGLHRCRPLPPFPAHLHQAALASPFCLFPAVLLLAGTTGPTGGSTGPRFLFA
jgi:hypothetical protein